MSAKAILVPDAAETDTQRQVGLREQRGEMLMITLRIKNTRRENYSLQQPDYPESSELARRLELDTPNRPPESTKESIRGYLYKVPIAFDTSRLRVSSASARTLLLRTRNSCVK